MIHKHWLEGESQKGEGGDSQEDVEGDSEDVESVSGGEEDSKKLKGWSRITTF
jgi:hypothetical protein